MARLALPTAALAVSAIPALWAGWWLGDRTFRRLHQGAFRWIVLGMLLLSGLLAGEGVPRADVGGRPGR